MRHQRIQRRGLVTVVGVAVLALTVGLSGCATGGGEMGATDADGMTQSQVDSLSLEKQFDLVEQRTVKMQVLLTEAQKHISTDVWRWLDKGALPSIGTSAPGVVEGATGENSYYLNASRAIQLPGAVGAVEDTKPMMDYFESKGWQTSVSDLDGDRHWVKADTGEGYLVDYIVQANGWYSVSVSSEMYWGDFSELLHAVGDRIPKEASDIHESLPGVFIPFPKWSDPVLKSDFLNP